MCDCVRPKTALCNPQHSEWAHTEVCCMNERAHRHTSVKCLNLKLPKYATRRIVHMDHGESVAPRAPDMRYQFFDKQTRHAIIMSR